MKKFVSAFLAAVILFTFCACSAKKKTVLVISGAEIDSEIFTYFFHTVVQRPQDYGLDEESKDSLYKEKAIEQCKEYLAANTRFAEAGLKLTAADKVEISETVNDLWLRFENHYKSVGVSKQTLTKIQTAEIYEDELFNATYDKGTNNAAAEQKIQDYFYSSYVSFKNVCAYYTKADGSQMSQLEKNQLVESFNAMASGTADVEKFGNAVADSGYSLSDSVLLKKNSDGYPEGFFEKVVAMDDNTVQVIVYDDCVFAVLKENLKEKGESVYANYRSACINDLYSAEYRQTIEGYTSTLTVEEKSGVDKIVKKYL